jgi:hypothetical protein
MYIFFIFNYYIYDQVNNYFYNTQPVLEDYVKGLMEKEENFEDEQENNENASEEEKENFENERIDEDADQGNCKVLINFKSKKKKDSIVLGGVFSVPTDNKKIKMESSTRPDFFMAKRKFQDDEREITIAGKKYKLMQLTDN